MPANERLRQQRIRRNWRQQDVADQLGIAITTVQRWERGYQQPSAYYRTKLCDLFGLSNLELGLEEDLSETEDASSEATSEQRRRPEAPGLWTIPYARNPHFTGRGMLLQQLEQVFALGSPESPTGVRQAALTQMQVIKGLGGIGKTQTAIEYAYRARLQGRYQHTLWIAAASEETILTSFVELASLLPDVVSPEETDPRKMVSTILRWLEQHAEPWLLIFDNADDLTLAQSYFPRQGKGHLLITTRASATEAFASSLEVDLMETMEGAQLLLQRANRVAPYLPEEMDEAMNIVIALVHFPLAIDQAGAYIEETGCSLQSYLQVYQSHRHALLARRGRQTMGYPESVVTTWSLSFAEVERTCPAATEFLQLCAVLAPNHIPEELLQEGAPYWPDQLREAVADYFSFNQMMEILLAFSLVKRFSEDRMVNIHLLVQAVQWDRMDAETQRAWSERAVRAIETVFPQEPTNAETWPQCQRYLEQVQACNALIQQQDLRLPEAADLLDRTGSYFLKHSIFSQAEPLYQRALAIRERQLGPEHLETADSLHGLAAVYKSQQLCGKGEVLARQALDIYEQKLGADDLETTFVRNTLALLYMHQGRFEVAEALFKHNLTICERQLGPEHLRTAMSLNPLASIYAYQGRYEEREQYFRRVLAIREKRFGPTHFQTAMVIHNLGSLYVEQGRYEEAEPLAQQALALYEQHLSPHHVRTADCLSVLADILLRLGKYTQAEDLVRRALDLHEEHLGPVHSYIADDLAILGTIYREQGRYAEAEPLFQRALQMNVPVMGPTLIPYEFALLREAQGRDEQAHALHQQALEACLQAGRTETHPLMVAVRQRLAALQVRLGRPEEATNLEGTQAFSYSLHHRSE